jgi:DNA-binding response OmpR family regulator
VNGPAVLVIDPDPEFATRLKKRLEASGFSVRVAFDGEDGLAQVRQQPPDILVLETMLPKASGLKVARLVHYDDRFAHIPIVFLSVRAHEQERQLAAYAGASEYLTKPVDFDRLLALLKTCAGKTGAGRRSP